MTQREPGPDDAAVFFGKAMNVLSPLELVVLGLLVRIEDLEEEQCRDRKWLEDIDSILCHHDLYLSDVEEAGAR